MRAVKTIAALVFLAAIGIALVQPVLRADDEDEVRASGEATQEPVSGGKTVDPGDENGPEQAPPFSLSSRYPKRCMRKTPPGPTGYLAARRGSSAWIGLPDRAPLASIAVEGDVAWSPSGAFLADSGGSVVDARGTPQGRLFFRASEWRWSPVADCVLALTERGNLTFGIAGTPRRGIRLVDAPVRDFEIAPNGRRLALVVDGRGLWLADLRGGRLTQAAEREPSLIGWYSNGAVLFSKSRGSGKVRYATGDGEVGIVRGAHAGATFERCGGRMLASSRSPEGNAALAELVSRRGRIVHRRLAAQDGYGGFSDASCSPDGGFLVASALTEGDAKGPLVLLEADGTFVRELVPGATANPEWSPDGLVFVKFGAAGRGRLWFVGPGGTPAPTEFTVGGPGQYDWYAR